MNKLCVALTLFIALCVGFFGLVITATQTAVHQPFVINDRFDGPYQSVATISSGRMIGSAVLLKSGVILTAAHCIDRNRNGKIDPGEKIMSVEFFTNDGTAFITTATAIAVSHTRTYEQLDLAILTLEKQPPVRGMELLSNAEYRRLTIGTEISTIGMMNGDKPANITTGLLTGVVSKHNHRTSATVYLGNSGGGVFLNDKRLIGIITKVGTDRTWFKIPILNEKGNFGTARVRFVRYLSCISNYVPVTSIRAFVEEKGLTDTVFPPMKLPAPASKPIPKHFYFISFSLANLLLLFGVFKGMNYLENKNGSSPK